MSSRNSRYLLRLATSEDSLAIGRVLESGGFPGRISVQFIRRPDPYQSFLNDGDELVMPAVVDRETGEIVAVGGCVLRQAHLGGEAVTTGYLTGMKVLEDHRGGAVPIRDAYELIRGETQGRCSAYITTILSGNTNAIRLLEKPRKGMPAYRFQGGYTVYCLGTGRNRRLPAGFRLVSGHSPEVETFYREQLPTYQFSPADEWLHGIRGGDFHTLQSAGGEILAACAVWNQQDYKQYRITGYNTALRLLQRLPTRLLGYPVIPRENSYTDYASITLLAVRPEAARYAGDFLRAVTAAAGKYDFLMLGLMDDHPLSAKVQRLPHIKYQSRVYLVDYGEGAALNSRPFMLEVGLL